MTRLTAPLAALALLAATALPAAACPYGNAEADSATQTPVTTAQGPMTPVPTTLQE